MKNKLVCAYRPWRDEWEKWFSPDNGEWSLANAAMLKLYAGVEENSLLSGVMKFGVGGCSGSWSCSLLLADAGGRSEAAAPESDESSWLPPVPPLPPVNSRGSHFMLSSMWLLSSFNPLPSTILLDKWLLLIIEKSVGVASLLFNGGDGSLGLLTFSLCGSYGWSPSFLRICDLWNICCIDVGIGVAADDGGELPRGKPSSGNFSWDGAWFPAANALTCDS